MGGDPFRREVLPVDGDVVGGPDVADHLQGFLEQRGPVVEIDSEGGELPLEVADADCEGESTAGHQVQRRAGLGHDERVAVRQHDDVGDQAQRGGVRGRETHRDEGVERVVPAGLEPPLTGSGVIGEAEPVEPGCLGGRGDPGDSRPGHQLRVVRVAVHRVGDGELHSQASSAVMRPNSTALMG